MESILFPYIAPASPEPDSLPLSRYLPPIPPGIISTWLQKNVPPGNLILDPFGSSPQVALEAAHAGYPVIVACNNPVTRFFLELLAEAPYASDFQSVISELAAQKRGTERLESSLLALYESVCPNCQQAATASAYLWRKDEKTPYAKILNCPVCSWAGEAQLAEKDFESLALTGNDAMHRARALSRVDIGEEEVRLGAKEAIDAYLPRQLYFLFTLMNKIQGLEIEAARKNFLWALFLILCDEGNMLWSHPASRTRPKQISIPTEFREANLWYSLEQLAAEWNYLQTPVPVQTFHQTPEPGMGITIYPGRVRDLLPLLYTTRITAVIASIPRPNQAFWTFSALWAGWIWGPEAVLPLKGSMQRKRYGWQWHANALMTTFHSLQSHLATDTKFFGIAAESNPGLLSSIITASENAGLALNGFAYREDDEITQYHWANKPLPPAADEKPGIDTAIRNGISSYLQERAEPADYFSLFSAGFLQLAQGKYLARGQKELPFNQISLLQNHFSQNFSRRNFLRRYESSAQNQEIGLWWLENGEDIQTDSFSDRVEFVIRSLLQSKNQATLNQLEEKLFARFPGLFTPTRKLVLSCLQSYARPHSPITDGWEIRMDEKEEARKADEQEMNRILLVLAEKFGHQCRVAKGWTDWISPSGTLNYRFFVQSHACINKIVCNPNHIPEQGIVVLPGSRSNLLAYKLQKNPYLAELATTGWHFLKFRHLRTLAGRPDLSVAEWKELLDADPPLWEEPQQLSIFNE